MSQRNTYAKALFARTDGTDMLSAFASLIRYQVNYMKYTGLWAPGSEDYSFMSRYLYFPYKLLILTVLFVFAITLLADILCNLDDLTIATDDGCIFAGILVVLFKVMVFQVRRERIAKLSDEVFDSVEQLYRTSVSDVEEILRSYRRRCMVSFYGFSVLGFLLVIALIFFVPTEPGALPIRTRYPFDTTISPWHEVGFLVEACAVAVGMTAIVGIDSMITNLCNLVLLQYEILNVDFENCRSRRAGPRNLEQRRETMPNDCIVIIGNEDATDHESSSDNFADQFKRCIRVHQRLAVIIADLNEIFSSSMFVQVLSSTSMICLTGFQAVAVAGQRSDFVKFSIYLSAAISQLFYICWIGNEVIEQSATVITGQWLSEWHKEDITSVSKFLIISMKFSNKNAALRAGKFETLSLRTFIAILRGSYSFFALLNNIHLNE